MATIYTFNFTDPAKASFTVQPYTSNGILSPTDGTVLPNAASANTTLKLYGKGMQEYGEGIEQNLVYMLEHFANGTRPLQSIEGQIWYNNVGAGSPATGSELFIRNDNSDDIIGWDAIILATGSSAMTGELILSGIPTNPNAAVPLVYVTTHENDTTLHLSPEYSTFLGGLKLIGIPPNLDSEDVNQLIGIDNTQTVQTQIDSKISRTGDVMDSAANLTFAGGGQILGLPNTPVGNNAATSKIYVDGLATSGIGDGYLSDVTWVTNNEPFIPGNTIQFTVSQLNQADTTFTAFGISREGHFHAASNITVDTINIPTYPSTVQDAIEYIELNKADLLDPVFDNNITVSNLITASQAIFSGSVTGIEPSAATDLTTKNYVDSLLIVPATVSVTRTIESLSADLISTPYRVQPHDVGDNLLSITVNGAKQYATSSGFQVIEFSPTVSAIEQSTATGLDTAITYDFNISVDGGSIETITIPAGSLITTHSDLINTIRSLFLNVVPPVEAIYDLPYALGTIATFASAAPSATSAISITDPTTTNQYLFAVDTTPIAIISVNFNVINTAGGSPELPDEIEIAGDLTLTFTVGKTFTILNSVIDTTGTYDATYSVHDQGATFNGVNTVIPLGAPDDSSVINPLATINLPAVNDFGDVYLTPFGGLISVNAPIVGLAGDYYESDSLGSILTTDDGTTHIVFNETIPLGSLIETILLS